MARHILAVLLSLLLALLSEGAVPLPGHPVYHYGDIEIFVKGAVLSAPMLRNRNTYCVFALGDTYLGKTLTVDNDNEPHFNSKTRFFVADYEDNAPVLKVAVVDKSTLRGDNQYGVWSIPLKDLVSRRKVEGTYFLMHPKKQTTMGDTIRLRITYREARIRTAYNGWAVDSIPGYVDRIRPPRRGNRVTLYSNAHSGDHEVIQSVPGYSPANCWEDIYRAMLGAKQFIMLTGWSVVHSIRLLRTTYVYDPEIDPDNGMLTLGELLKAKANTGVRVMILVWEDYTNMMGTGWSDTVEYFEGSGVIVAPVRRITSAYMGSYMITHHQKSVIVDAPPRMPGGERRLVAFVGGLDLSNGRWDTPKHPLFTTLTTYHALDFYSALLPEPVDPSLGPREPWHDIHAQFEGPIAQDVFWNFAVRWLKQAPEEWRKYLGEINNKYIRNILTEIRETKERDPLLPTVPPTHDLDQEQQMRNIDDREAWTSQLFRSIDGYATYDLEEGYGFNTLDKSIQLAYIHLIRRARKFIFIENQYFFGSAQFWEKGSNQATTEVNHLVPIELTRAIIRRIMNKERFAVYILLPMYPEGRPQDSTIQQMLIYQYKTVSMMYRMIIQALKKVGSSAAPTDYLNFYCAATREAAEGPLPHVESEDSFQARILKKRRSPIYCHSKMMIVDDTYILLGSANINGRSLAGSRDSEIAVGSFQPGHTMAEEEDEMPKGAVHQFRRALFSEHTNHIADECVDPSSLECVHFINKVAVDNWEVYRGEETKDMPSHLLKYPYRVSKFEDQPISPEIQYFPDAKEYDGFVYNPNIEGVVHSIVKDLLPSSISKALFS